MKVKSTNNREVQFKGVSDPEFKFISQMISVNIKVQNLSNSTKGLCLKLIITDRSENFYFNKKKARFQYIKDIILNENKVDIQYYSDLETPTLVPFIVMRVYLIKHHADGTFDRVVSWDQTKIKITS